MLILIKFYNIFCYYINLQFIVILQLFCKKQNLCHFFTYSRGHNSTSYRSILKKFCMHVYFDLLDFICNMSYIKIWTVQKVIIFDQFSWRPSWIFRKRPTLIFIQPSLNCSLGINLQIYQVLSQGTRNRRVPIQNIQQPQPDYLIQLGNGMFV